jgi:hypothetical protein
MANDRTQSSILGDINPKPGTEEHVRSKIDSDLNDEDDTMIVGRSERGRASDLPPAGVSGGLVNPTRGS